MAEQWIDAETALRVVASVSDTRSAVRAICIRAHDGIIDARAKLFVAGDRRTANAKIPPGFWWAKGEAALDQNWVTGDFSTWIKGFVA